MNDPHLLLTHRPVITRDYVPTWADQFRERKLTLAERLADMVRKYWPAVVFGFALGLMCICIPAIVLGAVL